MLVALIVSTVQELLMAVAVEQQAELLERLTLLKYIAAHALRYVSVHHVLFARGRHLIHVERRVSALSSDWRR